MSSTLSNTIILSEGFSDFKWSKQRRTIVSGGGLSLVSIASRLASSTNSLVIDRRDPALSHATRFHFASSHFSTRAAASWVLPQPRMPTRTVRRVVVSVTSAFNCSCSSRLIKRSSVTTSGRLPNTTGLIATAGLVSRSLMILRWPSSTLSKRTFMVCSSWAI